MVKRAQFSRDDPESRAGASDQGQTVGAAASQVRKVGMPPLFDDRGRCFARQHIFQSSAFSCASLPTET